MTALPTELPLAPKAPTPPALRLLPAPSSAPPYDDEPHRRPTLRLVAGPATRRSEPLPSQDDAWLAAERTPTAELPASQAFAQTLVQGVLEVLAGVRPITQLRRDTTPELFDALNRRIRARPRTPGARPDGRAVRSLHVQERPEGIVEVCATVQRGARTAAFALRLEGLDGRWKCTDLVGV